MNLTELKRKIAEDLKREFSREEMMGSCSSIVQSRFFQIVLKPIIERQESISDEYKSDWTKLLSDVDLNSGILSEFIRAAWGIYSGTDVNLVDIDTNQYIPKNCVMVWTACPDKKQLDKLGKLMQDSLGSKYEVVVISGNHTTNRKVEKKIKTLVLKARTREKKLVLVSKYMGSRSFSIPEIDATFLWYDNGSVDSTAQRISRVFTNGKTWNGEKKSVGDIVSFSFDPNRDESNPSIDSDDAEPTPIDDYIVNEAEKVENEELNDSIKRVLRSIQMFTNIGNGVIPMDEVTKSDYVQKLVNSSSLLNVAEVSINPLAIDVDDDFLSDVNLDKETKSKVDAIKRGKVKRTADDEESTKPTKERKEVDEEEKSIRIRREVLKSVIRRVIDFSAINKLESDNFIEMLDMIHQKALDDEVIVEIGVDTRVIKRWAEAGAFPLKLLNTIITSFNDQYKKKVS